jgi:hypothetical protein
MSEQEKFKVAKEYIDKQLETMKKHGSAPKQLSKQEYRTLIQQVAATVRC